VLLFCLSRIDTKGGGQASRCHGVGDGDDVGVDGSDGGVEVDGASDVDDESVAGVAPALAFAAVFAPAFDSGMNFSATELMQ